MVRFHSDLAVFAAGYRSEAWIKCSDRKVRARLRAEPAWNCPSAHQFVALDVYKRCTGNCDQYRRYPLFFLRTSFKLIAALNAVPVPIMYGVLPRTRPIFELLSRGLYSARAASLFPKTFLARRPSPPIVRPRGDNVASADTLGDNCCRYRSSIRFIPPILRCALALRVCVRTTVTPNLVLRRCLRTPNLIQITRQFSKFKFI